MTTSLSFDQVAELASQLAPNDRLRLVERIAHDLAACQADGDRKRPPWSAVRGIVAYPYLGEDAPERVSKRRHESDARRAQQGKVAS